MFHAGQHVVCVDDSEDAHGCRALTNGAVYTISGTPNYYVEVVEVPDALYWPRRFRPLSSTRLDVFRQLLVSPKERVGA